MIDDVLSETEDKMKKANEAARQKMIDRLITIIPPSFGPNLGAVSR